MSYDLQNALDIQRCKHDFIRRANGILSCFGSCTPEVFTQLLHSYCMVILLVCTVEFELLKLLMFLSIKCYDAFGLWHITVILIFFIL